MSHLYILEGKIFYFVLWWFLPIYILLHVFLEERKASREVIEKVESAKIVGKQKRKESNKRWLVLLFILLLSSLGAYNANLPNHGNQIQKTKIQRRA